MAAMPAESQEKLLEEAKSMVKEQAFFMKRAIDTNNLREVLKHSSNMICELRTSMLSPKNYYELYMQVFQELQKLGEYLAEGKHGKRNADLYESVQYAGNILPRLYLLITVGANYIRSKEAGAKDILKDLTELCKGVQHPMRGLFLRYYLSQMCKDKLPDVGSEFESEEGGGIYDAIDFIHQNFVESTALWVRLKNQGYGKDKQRRELERHDLRVLVGFCLIRLSQLEGLTRKLYCDLVLTNILEQVLNCKDVMAQQYLLDCVIHVFPDEFHLHTLELLLGACTKVHKDVDLKGIMENLMGRLEVFIDASPEAATQNNIDIFSLFRMNLQEIMERPLKDATPGEVPEAVLSSSLSLQVAFLSFTVKLFPGNLQYVDIVLGSTSTMLSQALGTGEEGKQLTGAAADSGVELLALPLRASGSSSKGDADNSGSDIKYLSGMGVLAMENYANLMTFLSLETKIAVASSMVQAVVDSEVEVDSLESLERFLQYVKPLLVDEGRKRPSLDDEEAGPDQTLVCQLIHRIKHPDPDVVFQLLALTRQTLESGGTGRLKQTLPALLIRCMQLVDQVQEAELAGESPQAKPKKVFQYLHKTCLGLVGCHPDLALRMWLQCAITCANYCTKGGEDAAADFGPICAEFVTQALIVFEEEVSDSKAQFAAITQMVNAVGYCTCLDEETYATIAGKLAQHGAKLLRKENQCQAILVCSHMFWNSVQKNERRVLECLQRTLKVANLCVQASSNQVGLFVDILDKYVYYHEQGNSEIAMESIQQLIVLCETHINSAEEETPQVVEARERLARTVAHCGSA